jgi:hypothetical protein
LDGNGPRYLARDKETPSIADERKLRVRIFMRCPVFPSIATVGNSALRIVSRAGLSMPTLYSSQVVVAWQLGRHGTTGYVAGGTPPRARSMAWSKRSVIPRV